MANYNHGGGASGDPTETLLAQLRRQSSPSPGPGAGQDQQQNSHFGGYNHSQGGQQSFYSHHSNTDSPNPGGYFQDGMDSPGFPPVAPTPPVHFGHSQYPPGMMNPIGTGRGAAPVGDERTAQLLNLLKFNGPSNSNNSQPTSRDHPMSFSHAPAPTIIHAPAPTSADPTGLLAALMKGNLQSEQPKPEAPAPSTWNQAAPPSDTTQRYLLDLLHRPKPSQNDSNEPHDQSILTPPPGDDDARDMDDMQRSAEPTLVDAMPSQSDFEYDREPMESPHPKFDSTPHSQHSHATSNQYGMHGGHGNPFEDLSGTSPVHRTPTSTTPGASASGHAAAAPIRILKKPDSAHSDHDQKRPLSDRGAVPSPEHARRKLDHTASPLSQASAPRSIHQNMSPQSDRSHTRPYNTAEGTNGAKKESVAQAVSGIAEQADREAREAIARVQEEQAQADLAQNLHNLNNARTEHEFDTTAQIAAMAIKKQLDRDPNNAVLDATLSPDVAKEVRDIIEEAAHGPLGVADSWESADADEIVVEEEREAPVKVYNFPMKPWIAISLLESDLPRPTFRDDSVLDIARLKKDFDQVDRNLASGSETYMAYGMSKAGGLRVIRQEDGKDAKLFTDTKDRIFNVSISSSPPGDHRKEAIIGTGVSGTVYWVQLRNGDRDHLGDTHPEQYGFALPPISTQEGDAPGGILKTRARASSVHPEFFAVGRGKSINIIWPSFILENNLFKQGHDRVVDTERLLKQCSLKINTGKAGKDFTFSQDDSVVVSLDKSGRVKFWDVRDLVAIKEGSDPSAPMPVNTSLEIKEPLMTLTSTPEGEKAWPTSVLLLDKFRPYQKRVALRYMIVGMKQNHTLQLWDLALGKPVQEFNFPHNKESDAVCSVMYHAPSSMIVVGHPTRNSIYFLHLSAPKYSLKNLSQVEYIQRLVAQDPSIPMPDSTAVISGIREYSWAKKGVLRSLSIVENASSSSSESEEPTLFELYAMHSKGVTCINVKQGELGWTKDNKVISSADAVDAGMAKINKLAPPPTQPSSEAQQPATPADGHATPQIRIAARGGRDSLQKASAASEDKKGQDVSTPKLERKDEVETPVPQTERAEKKGRKKRNAADRAAAAAADRDLPSLSGATDLGRTLMSPNKNAGRRGPPPVADSSALALTNQFGEMALAPATVSQDHLDALVANMESRLVSSVSGRFDSVFSDVMKQMQAFQDNRDSAFVTNQSALLQMVSTVLNDNVESVMKNHIEDQISGSVIPALRSAVDKTVSDQLAARSSAQTNSLQKEIQRLLPSAVTQSMQKPDIVKTISDKVSHNVNYYIEAQITKSLEAIVPDIASITAKTVHQRVVEDVGAQLNDAIARMEDRMEDRRRVEDEKLDRLIGQTMDLSSAISSLAASQVQFQDDLTELKVQLQQDREREPVVQDHGLGQGRSRDSVGSHGKPAPVPRDMVPYQPQHQAHAPPQHAPQHAPQHVAQQHHAQPHHFPEQVVFAPATSRESRESRELKNAMDRIDGLMRNNNTDEAILAWLHDTDKAEEIFLQVLSKYSPTCITELQPLVLLSVGATISGNFTRASDKIVEKVSWLEVAVLAFDRMVPNLVCFDRLLFRECKADIFQDEQVRGVTPKIMSLVKERAENLFVEISRVAPHDPTLKTLGSIAHHARRIEDLFRPRNSGPQFGQGPAY